MTYQGKTYQLDKDNFKIKEGRIYYKNIPMWNTISTSLEGYKFYIIDERDWKNGFVTICCEDNREDLFHYGKFGSLKKCTEWLLNPQPLY